MEEYNQGSPGYYDRKPPFMAMKPFHKPSLVLGIIAIVSTWFTLGILGLICGIIGVSLARKNMDEYNTTAGAVLSLIALIVSIIILIVVACFIFVLKLAPDSIGAYYIEDMLDNIFGMFGR